MARLLCNRRLSLRPRFKPVHIVLLTLVALSFLTTLGCKKSGSNKSDGKPAHLSEPVYFRGKQFSTNVPGGWVVSFPDETTRFQIGKLVKGKDGYAAVIRLDTGTPKEDLAATAKGFATQYKLKETDSDYDWAGQKSILLEGDSQGLQKPQLLVLTFKFKKFFILSVAKKEGINTNPELEYLLENWQWDEK